MQLNKVVVVVVRIKYERLGVESSNIDQKILFEKSTQSQVGSYSLCCSIGFNEGRCGSECQSIAINI